MTQLVVIGSGSPYRFKSIQGRLDLTECLFVHTTEQVEGFDGNVGSLKATLQEAPEVLQALRVNCTVNIAFKVIHDLVYVVRADLRIALMLIGVYERASVNREQVGSEKPSTDPRTTFEVAPPDLTRLLRASFKIRTVTLTFPG
jgi:hypothetical protein